MLLPGIWRMYTFYQLRFQEFSSILNTSVLTLIINVKCSKGFEDFLNFQYFEPLKHASCIKRNKNCTKLESLKFSALLRLPAAPWNFQRFENSRMVRTSRRSSYNISCKSFWKASEYFTTLFNFPLQLSIDLLARAHSRPLSYQHRHLPALQLILLTIHLLRTTSHPASNHDLPDLFDRFFSHAPPSQLAYGYIKTR